MGFTEYVIHKNKILAKGFQSDPLFYHVDDGHGYKLVCVLIVTCYGIGGAGKHFIDDNSMWN